MRCYACANLLQSLSSSLIQSYVVDLTYTKKPLDLRLKKVLNWG